MEVIIKPYWALPCSLEEFTINGIEADQSDFGCMDDTDTESAEPYGCGCMEFIPDVEPAEGVLEKYNITQKEFIEIQEMLKDKLFVGACGWCV